MRLTRISVFDVEGLCYDIESSQRVMESLLDPLFGRIANTGKKLRIVQAHDDLASRLYRVRSLRATNNKTTDILI